ncbi:hypothetical protein N9X90_08060, partial [Alphaproteobacteria bacterium]|nr:hypothetical protein [Alphaproteobacteria bacterium]
FLLVLGFPVTIVLLLNFLSGGNRKKRASKLPSIGDGTVVWIDFLREFPVAPSDINLEIDRKNYNSKLSVEQFLIEGGVLLLEAQDHQRKLEALDYLNEQYASYRKLNFPKWLIKNGPQWLRKKLQSGEHLPIKIDHFSKSKKAQWGDSQFFDDTSSNAVYDAMKILGMIDGDFLSKFYEWKESFKGRKDQETLNETSYLVDLIWTCDPKFIEAVSELNKQGITLILRSGVYWFDKHENGPQL